MNKEEHIKNWEIGLVLSEKNKQNKQMQEPFLRRLLLNIDKCTEVEQNLYNFIYNNWVWCLPIYKNAGTSSRILIGYRMLDKKSVMKQAFDFG